MKRLQPGAWVALSVLYLAAWSAPLAALAVPAGTTPPLSSQTVAGLVLLALLATAAATRLAFGRAREPAPQPLPAWRPSTFDAWAPTQPGPSGSDPRAALPAASTRAAGLAPRPAAGPASAPRAPVAAPGASAPLDEASVALALRDVARELRARLDGVLSTSELLVQELQGPDQRALADLMHDSAEELAELAAMADELATLSVGPAPAAATTAVCPLSFLQRTVTGARAAVRSRLSNISLVVAPDLPAQVRLDEQLWGRLLAVLLRCLVRIQDRAVLTVSAERLGDSLLRLRLSSTGRSAAAPAPAATEARGGSLQPGLAGSDPMRLAGLGLLLPARLVGALGGRLSVERTGESGAALELLLPVSGATRRATPVWEAW